jgi:hypothetical protein
MTREGTTLPLVALFVLGVSSGLTCTGAPGDLKNTAILLDGYVLRSVQ